MGPTASVGGGGDQHTALEPKGNGGAPAVTNGRVLIACRLNQYVHQACRNRKTTCIFLYSPYFPSKPSEHFENTVS